MTIDPAKYTISLQQREIDGEVLFAARVKELPDVEVFEPTADGAYGSAIAIIKSLASVAEEENREFPAPSDVSVEEEFSGRVTLRMPKGLHRRIAFVSEHEGVSLNQYIVTVLALASAEETSVFSRKPSKAEISPSMKDVSMETKWKVYETYSRIFKAKIESMPIRKTKEGRFVILPRIAPYSQIIEEDEPPTPPALVTPVGRSFGKGK